ncbi:shieldin complex subunit 2 isoform X2 [Syngnathoides biaculeatus]|uniref:shieldin complex subunit 2 isoform X2 n=1 Tax=Syngnathoides biaculeatus TaxID=300417 RepID=UPI002ADDCB97|nr:shieldin complex subunit 2 isoform X2 [Syngnathoides biaculeatus]
MFLAQRRRTKQSWKTKTKVNQEVGACQNSACERPTVHVFLGAPRARPDDDGGSRRGPAPRRRRLELTWREGRLVPANGEEEESIQEAKRSRQDSFASRSHPSAESPQRSQHPYPADQAEAQLSLRSRDLSARTPTRAVILRGVGSVGRAPELFSATTSSDELSGGWRQSSGRSPVAGRAERGGVVPEAASDGILRSQEAERRASGPCSKRTGLRQGGPRDDRCGSSATLLGHCADATTLYRVLVAVVHPCHLKEIKVKRGPSAGSSVPLASLVVTDQSGVDVTVALWRRAAFWAAAVDVGDVVFITGLQLSKDGWSGEKILKSTFSSKLLNLGHVGAPICPPGGRHGAAVSALSAFLGRRRPPLLSAPRRRPRDLKRVPYAPLWPCRVNTLIHALVRVKHAYVGKEWQEEAESRRRCALERHAVASVEGAGGQRGALLLRGSALEWLARFRTHRDAVWDIRFLLVREGSNADFPELHTTPWSAARRADGADRRLGGFLRPGESAVEMDVDTLLSQQYSGEASLRVEVLAFGFQPSHDAPRASLDRASPPAAILAALSEDVTYSGCGRCSAELDADANGIYAPCYPCLPAGGVRRYYRFPLWPCRRLWMCRPTGCRGQAPTSSTFRWRRRGSATS